MKTYRFKSKENFLEHCRGPYFNEFKKYFYHWAVPFKMSSCGNYIIINYERIESNTFRAFGVLSRNLLEEIED